MIVVGANEERRTLTSPAGVAIEWLVHGGEAPVEAVARWWATAPDVGDRPAAWLAGELSETRAVRDLVRTIDRYAPERIASFPYWRRGRDATTFDESRAAAIVAAREASVDPATVDDLDLDG